MRQKIYGGNAVDDCITCKLIEPIYDFKNNYKSFSTIIYGIAIILWILSALQIIKKYADGNIVKFDDLFII
jgi:hypothetical protein